MFYDNGIVNVYKFKISPDTGRLMENLVAVELLRRGADFYYFRNSRGAEVDFILKEAGKIAALVQVCYDIKSPEVKERECRSLLRGSEELNCRSLFVITWDDEREEKHKDFVIHFIPLWKWLMGVLTIPG
jgi:predicted AAA+ superfamily ATPase